ncbi:MAG: Zn-dependent hydrolase [Candidatus Methylomirabilales bacterium]
MTERITDRVNGDRIAADLAALAERTRHDQPGFTRLAYSEEDRQARAWLRDRMEAAGLTVRLDAAANVIGRHPGASEGAILAVGSHIDTVPNGGRFDGMAGVAAGLEIARVLSEAGRHLRHPLEVIAFTNEEPNAFGLSTVGSRAMAGKLTAPRARELRDPDGRTLAEAIDFLGGEAAHLDEARRSRGAIAHYLELHIEQGPVLDRERIPVGVVTGIAAPTRLRVRVDGRPDHAGTTPMGMRKDALAGAAEIVLALERIATEAGESVGTVGQLVNQPNHANVVPGHVEMTVEFRSIFPERIGAVRARFLEAMPEIAQRRGLEASWEFLMEERPLRISPQTVELAAAVCRGLGIPFRTLPSGASHDANHIAEIAPVSMLFVPSVGGRSHCPEELTHTADLAAGTRALLGVLVRLDETL